MSDLWEQYFPGYKEEQATFERDLESLLVNQNIIHSLHQFGYDAAFLKDLMVRLRGTGNTKALKNLLQEPYMVNKVLETFSREDWSDESKIISVSNYLEYGEKNNTGNTQINSSEKLWPDMNPELRAKIRDVDLDQLQKQFRGAEYRKLIQQHIRKIGARLELSLEAAVMSLTEEERNVAEILIDEYNAKGYQQDFWRLDCADVLKDVCNKFTKAMSHKGLSTDERIMFNIFQIITMNLALQARDQKELRKYAGIRKNWLFR